MMVSTVLAWLPNAAVRCARNSNLDVVLSPFPAENRYSIKLAACIASKITCLAT